MSLWVVVAVMTALTAALLAGPLVRRRRFAASRAAAPDLAVYRAQLAEIEYDLSIGPIYGAEAAATRTEIERRVPAAGAAHLAITSDDKSDQQNIAERRPVYAMAFVFMTMVGAVGLYLTLGTPGLPSMPLAEREAPTEERTQDFALLVERLAARMEANPSDPRGWLLLARSYARIDRFAESASAYRRAIELGIEEPEVLAAYGEALVSAGQGVVSPQARAAFDAAHTGDPGNPWARYYLGLAAAQAGKPQTAYDTWLALAADTPASALWRVPLEAQIRRAAEELGIASVPIPIAVERGKGEPPSDKALAAATNMSEDERAALIRSTIDRLAERLAAEPDDFDGWMRLGQAYRALGGRNGASRAFQKAGDLASTPSVDPAARRAVQQALEELRTSTPSR